MCLGMTKKNIKETGGGINITESVYLGLKTPTL